VNEESTELIVASKAIKKKMENFNINENAVNYLKDAHAKYMVEFGLKDHLTSDALMGALYFFYMTFDQNIEPDMKVKYFRVYTDTLKSIGILNPRELLNKIIERMSKEKEMRALMEEL
jgi:hypothetical protein